VQGKRRDKVGQTDPMFYDGRATTPAKGVNAGHRAGKRRRGNSVQRIDPKDTARAIPYRVTDSDGDTVAKFTTIVRHRKP
jgi:hypothetical protein